jgi:hypothetical protein
MVLCLPFCVGSTWCTSAGMLLSPPIQAQVTLRYLSTQYTPDILTPSILSRAQRRAFQQYVYKRSSDIWPTRTALLAYERALDLEAQVEALSDSTLTLSRARSRSRSVEAKAREIALGEGDIVKESQRVHDAREVLPIFEVAYAEWKALGGSNCDPRPHGLERFDRGMSSCIVIHNNLPHNVGVWHLDRSCSHTHRAEGRRSSRHSERVRSRTRSTRDSTRAAPLEAWEAREMVREARSDTHKVL